jgi:hypothetical protein
MKDFAHRENGNGTFDSICLGCYLTVATARREEDLTAEERRHHCWASRSSEKKADKPNEPMDPMWDLTERRDATLLQLTQIRQGIYECTQATIDKAPPLAALHDLLRIEVELLAKLTRLRSEIESA